MAAGGHLGFYPFKKMLEINQSLKVDIMILKVDIIGYKKQSITTIIYIYIYIYIYIIFLHNFLIVF